MVAQDWWVCTRALSKPLIISNIEHEGKQSEILDIVFTEFGSSTKYRLLGSNLGVNLPSPQSYNRVRNLCFPWSSQPKSWGVTEPGCPEGWTLQDNSGTFPRSLLVTARTDLDFWGKPSAGEALQARGVRCWQDMALKQKQGRNSASCSRTGNNTWGNCLLKETRGVESSSQNWSCSPVIITDFVSSAENVKLFTLTPDSTDFEIIWAGLILNR